MPIPSPEDLKAFGDEDEPLLEWYEEQVAGKIRRRYNGTGVPFNIFLDPWPHLRLLEKLIERIEAQGWVVVPERGHRCSPYVLRCWEPEPGAPVDRRAAPAIPKASARA